ncbi:MAG: RidA family protein [Gammaproteobacteria bacterium]|nr:RidA family protein [Gammaproteobacteria bacterium]
MTRQTIGGALTLAEGTILPLSKGMRAGDFVFLSGQLGLTGQGRLAGPGIEVQTRQCVKNIEALLAEAGCNLEHVVKITVWLVDRADFAHFNQVYAEYFGHQPPVRSTVVSGLVLPGALVEIEAVAYAP